MTHRIRSFDQWMAAVNRAMANIAQLEADDIDDWRYWDSWDAMRHTAGGGAQRPT